MKSPLEKSVVRNILKFLNAQPRCLAKKYWSSMQGVEVDIYGCIDGRAFFLEVKRDAKRKPTDHQQSMINEWLKTGAVAGVVWDVESVKTIFGIGG